MELPQGRDIGRSAPLPSRRDFNVDLRGPGAVWGRLCIEAGEMSPADVIDRSLIHGRDYSFALSGPGLGGGAVRAGTGNFSCRDVDHGPWRPA